MFKLNSGIFDLRELFEILAQFQRHRAKRSGTQFKPQEGQQFEIGAKASLLGGKVTASIAAFDLTLTNVLTADPVNTGYSIAAGKVRSRGVELDVAGQITDNISIIGSYTYDDAMVVKDNTIGTGAILGKRQPGVPRHAGNIWAKYDTAPGEKEGFSFRLRLHPPMACAKQPPPTPMRCLAMCASTR